MAAPYYIFKDGGYNVILASPSGGKITWDEVSLAGDAKTAEVAKFLDDAEAVKAVNESHALSSIKSDDIAAVFLAGGHGAAFDFPGNKALADLLTESYKKGGFHSTHSKEKSEAAHLWLTGFGGGPLLSSRQGGLCGVPRTCRGW